MRGCLNRYPQVTAQLQIFVREFVAGVVRLGRLWGIDWRSLRPATAPYVQVCQIRAAH